MFVVETLTDVPIYKAFGSSMAAQRWAESAHLEHYAQQCRIYRTISGLNSMQAVAAVKLGKAERLLTVRRRGTDGVGFADWSVRAKVAEIVSEIPGD
jgi:hypothetical protein